MWQACSKSAVEWHGPSCADQLARAVYITITINSEVINGMSAVRDGQACKFERAFRVVVNEHTFYRYGQTAALQRLTLSQFYKLMPLPLGPPQKKDANGLRAFHDFVAGSKQCTRWRRILLLGCIYCC
jgi:hypothetical protein